MILAIDIGNTTVALGGIRDGRVCFVAHMDTVRTRTAAEYRAEMDKIFAHRRHPERPMRFEGAVLTSVVPQITGALAECARHYTGKKPVIVYILILFLAAFLLMFLSMLSHQRSNAEALGQLQNSVSAIQEIQTSQEQVIELQKQLSDVQTELDATQEESQEKDDSIAQLEKEADALLALYNLQQEYAAGNLDGCLLTLQEISDQHLDELLPSTNTEGVTPPAQRYQELKEAILNK